jgi:hypothetical protein
MQLIIQFNSSFDFSKCRKLYIRGYNKAGVWATVSTEIRKCNNDDGGSLIVANMVIDAIGRQEYSLGKYRRCDCIVWRYNAQDRRNIIYLLIFNIILNQTVSTLMKNSLLYYFPVAGIIMVMFN